jgi:DNA-binding CsgD family transcriptional regulator
VLCIGSETHEDLIADATLIAARNMHNAELKGKSVSGSSAAFYAIQHCKSGRRAVGHSSTDVHGSSTQLNGRSRLESLETVVAEAQEAGGEIYLLGDVLSTDAIAPSMAVTTKLDWHYLCAQLQPREKAIITLIVEGMSGSAIARKLKVCASTISNSKKNMVLKIQQVLGTDILLEVGKLPRWKQDLQTIREQMACKHERSH